MIRCLPSLHRVVASGRHALAVSVCALAALQPHAAYSQSTGSVQAGDAQAVFETLMFRNCQRQAKGLLDSLKRELGSLESGQPVEDLICGCTVKALTDAPRVKAVFEGGPEKLRDIGSDKPLMDYMKGKTVSVLLQCTGVVVDRIIDPK